MHDSVEVLLTLADASVMGDVGHMAARLSSGSIAAGAPDSWHAPWPTAPGFRLGARGVVLRSQFYAAASHVTYPLPFDLELLIGARLRR